MSQHSVSKTLLAKRSDIEAQIPRSMGDRLTFELIEKSVAMKLSQNEQLRNCTASSIYLAVLEAVQLGLLPGSKEAHLVPYKQQCTLQIGYQGLTELAMRHADVLSIHTQTVYANDHFVAHLGASRVEHTRDINVDDFGEVVGAYTLVEIAGSSRPLLELIGKPDIRKFRRMANAKSPAWKGWQEEMVRKSCLKRAMKYAPSSRHLDRAVAFDNRDVIDAVPVRTGAVPVDAAGPLVVEPVEPRKLAQHLPTEDEPTEAEKVPVESADDEQLDLNGMP